MHGTGDNPTGVDVVRELAEKIKAQIRAGELTEVQLDVIRELYAEAAGHFGEEYSMGWVDGAAAVAGQWKSQDTLAAEVGSDETRRGYLSGYFRGYLAGLNQPRQTVDPDAYGKGVVCGVKALTETLGIDERRDPQALTIWGERLAALLRTGGAS